ncbi:MAG: phosphate ABC transporter permease PstA [Lactobacillus sp.]|nr:phosphate ABC transporter permease PstA [Lactobacillus sp.]MDN6042951.1 phosphate ABC transporter permease PstA [Lactobacillus sp.]MDN6052584.1 phosphate ABC transporter permease PstA [Lactobacillus sp.]
MNRYRVNQIMTGILNGVTLLVVLFIAAFILYLLASGMTAINWRFLTTSSEVGLGIRDQLFNSLYLLLLTQLISLPIALGAAMALTLYVDKRSKFASFAQGLIQILSSLPSIIVGLFGFLILVLKFNLGFSIISGALALTFFNLPILTQSIAVSLQGVPDEVMQSGLALGISKWHTITKIILPEAMPGIWSGIVISAGRVFGEAATLIYTAGQSAPTLDYTNWNPLNPASPLNIFRPAETLAVHIWKVNTESLGQDAATVSRGTIVILILVVLLFNLVARYFSTTMRKKVGR